MVVGYTILSQIPFEQETIILIEAKNIILKWKDHCNDHI
jgi:hypothetical protein